MRFNYTNLFVDGGPRYILTSRMTFDRTLVYCVKDRHTGRYSDPYTRSQAFDLLVWLTDRDKDYQLTARHVSSIVLA